MPQKLSVRSLEKMCLETVAENMKHVWATDYRDNRLTGFHVQELICVLRGTKHFTPALLYSFLLPQMTELDLSSCPKLVLRNFAPIIAARCKNLSSLNLHGCQRIPADALVRLVEGLPRLTSLDLSETQCNRRVLAAVGSSCQQLHELSVSWCKRLSLASLPYLAYDRNQKSFSCQALKTLNAYDVGGSGDHFSALVFVLLALPKLKYLGHEFVSDAIFMIHHQELEYGQLPRGFPSLMDLAERLLSTHTEERMPRLTLPLLKVDDVGQSQLPLVSAVCPLLTNVEVHLGTCLLAHDFLSCRHLTHLKITCRKESPRDLRELLPVTACLGAQLQSLVISNFSFVEEFSFHALLSHLPRLQEFNVSLLSPQRPRHERQPNAEAMDWDFSLSSLEFPHLSDFYLQYSKTENHLPYYHAMALRKSVISVMKQSPCLKFVNLNCLPFSLDEVFQKVLDPAGAALQQLYQLVLVQSKISKDTIKLLLSLENPLNLLCLKECPDISKEDYEELLERVSSEGLDLTLEWKCLT